MGIQISIQISTDEKVTKEVAKELSNASQFASQFFQNVFELYFHEREILNEKVYKDFQKLREEILKDVRNMIGSKFM
jgi:hypothetical protein